MCCLLNIYLLQWQQGTGFPQLPSAVLYRGPAPFRVPFSAACAASYIYILRVSINKNNMTSRKRYTYVTYAPFACPASVSTTYVLFCSIYMSRRENAFRNCVCASLMGLDPCAGTILSKSNSSTLSTHARSCKDCQTNPSQFLLDSTQRILYPTS